MHLESKNVLVTGVKSGLGKYIKSNLPSVGLCRNRYEDIFLNYSVNKFDAIIHCAFNSKRDIDDYYTYYQDNLALTERLCKLNFKKFIYISSVDVHKKELTPYNLTKRIAESIVKRNCKNHVIIRPSAILGKDIRRNSLIKIIEDASPKLTLSGESTFNYVLQRDLLEFINKIRHEDLVGEYDFVSSTNVTLNEIQSVCGKSVEFGEYTYETSELSNEKLQAVFPRMKQSSEDVVRNFIKEVYE
jgi:nucleoside-diphosphate-sugar epimerase